MEDAASATAIGTMMVFGIIFGLAAHLFFGYCFKRIAERAGISETAIWWVPIFNYLLVFKAAGKPGWWLLLMLVPLVNIVVAFVVWVEVARNLGHGTGWGIVAVVFSIVGVPYLAFAEPATTAVAA